jgi:hypothetical protein
MGEHIPTPQSSGGENDTLGALLDDRFQGHWHGVGVATGSGVGVLKITITGNAEDLSGPFYSSAARANDSITDGTNGTPRTGLTTRPKELTEGASYIIVMTDA